MIQSELTLHAETCLAGALLVDGRCFANLPPRLSQEDFLSKPAKAVYTAAKALYEQKKDIDPVTILKWTAEHNIELPADYCRQAMEVTPTAAHAAQYAQQVYEGGLRRALEQVCDGVMQDGYSGIRDLVTAVKCCTDDIWERLEERKLTRPASEFRYEEPRWVIAPYFQRGKGTLIQADPGTGKTAFMCAVAAAVSTGRGFLGLKVEAPGDVVMLSNEDSPGQLRGRLEANGADLSRIHMMENPYQYSFNSPEIEQVILRHKARMIIFDPFQGFLGAKIDLHRANETRPILAKLFAMCEAHDCACVMIAHLGKNTMGKSYVNQSLGSVDIPGAMRSILHILPHPEIEGQLMACQVKCSSAARGKTIAYSIGKRGGVNWLDLTEDRIDDLANPVKAAKRGNISFADDPLTKVLRSMTQERPQGGFWTYDALREQCRKVVGMELFSDARNLARLLTPSYLEELLRTDGLQIQLGIQSHGKRGLRMVNTRLAPPPQPEPVSRSEYDEVMDFLNRQSYEDS